MHLAGIHYRFSQIYVKYKNVTNSRAIGRHFFALLFVKYITDCQKDAYERYLQQYGDDKALIERKMSRERFLLPEGASFDDIAFARKDPAIGDIINRILNVIERTNSDKLSGIFGHVDFNNEYDLGETRERNRFLSEAISSFEDIDLRPSNSEHQEILEACIQSIAAFTELTSSKGGEFFTPSDIAKAVVQLIDPKEGDRIYDPACGSGGFLTMAAQAVRDKQERSSHNYTLYGQEINKEVWAWATMNMYLSGLDDIHLAWGDVIMEPAWKKDDQLTKFDIVVSTLPFASDVWKVEEAQFDKYGRFKWGLPPRTRADFALIQHIIASAEDKTGRIGIVIPQGVLFREGKEQVIRKGIICDNLIEAVIALPSNLFLNTAVPCAIMILSKAKGDNKNILFINAAADFEPGKFRNKLREGDIQKIFTIFQRFKDDPTPGGPATIERYSRSVTLEEIAGFHYNLNVAKYVDAFEKDTDEDMDVPSLRGEIETLERELEQLRSIIKKNSAELGLGGAQS